MNAARDPGAAKALDGGVQLDPYSGMDEIELFQRFGTAIAIGGVVGVERHWRERNEEAGQRTAGLRTFALVGMLGGTAGILGQAVASNAVATAIVVAGSFAAFAAVFALYQYREAVAEENYSATTMIAALLTFALGAMAILGNLALASAGAVAMVAILASREVLHRFVRLLSWPELRSAVVLLGMTFVVLPLVPDKPIGPFGGISPSKTWLLVVILAAMSFCGYIAVRLLGSARGELVAGLVGGLVSSTGATLTNARRSAGQQGAGTSGTLAAGAMGACATSYLRTAVLVGLLAAPLSLDLMPALVAAGLAIGGCAWLSARHDETAHAEQAPKNPFDLDAVIEMALLLVVVAFLARAASQWFGGSGLIIVSALSGLADVDAAVVTVGGMLNQLASGTAVAAIGAAVIANTCAKAAYALSFGSRTFGLRFLLASAAALAAGLGAYWAQRLIVLPS